MSLDDNVNSTPSGTESQTAELAGDIAREAEETVNTQLYGQIPDIVALFRKKEYHEARLLADDLSAKGVPITAINSDCCSAFDVLKYKDRAEAVKLAGEFAEDYEWHYWLGPRTAEENNFINKKRDEIITMKSIKLKLGLRRNKYV